MKRKFKLVDKGNGINFYGYDSKGNVYEVKKNKGGWFFICKLKNGELIYQGDPIPKKNLIFIN